MSNAQAAKVMVDRGTDRPYVVTGPNDTDPFYLARQGEGGGSSADLAAAGIFVPPTDDYAGILIARSAAIAAGGGVLQLKPVVYDIGGNTIPYTANVLIRGSGWRTESTSDGQPAASSVLPGGYPSAGTILLGNRTAPLIAANHVDVGDIDNNGPYAANIVSRTIHGGGVADLAMVNGTFGLKVGALNDAGPQHALFSNLYAWGCSQGGIWLENFSMCHIKRIFTSYCSVSGLTLASSGGTFNWGNSRVEQVFNNKPFLPFTGTPTEVPGRHLWVLTRAGSALNDVRISAFTSTASNFGQYPEFNAIAATATSGAGNVVDFAVSDLTKFPWGAPVTFSTAPSGFTVNRIYFVSERSGTSGAGTVRLRNAMHDTAHIAVAGLSSAACVFRSLGRPHIEFSSQLGDEARPLLAHPDGVKAITNCSVDSPTDVEVGGTARVIIGRTRYCYFDLGGFSGGLGSPDTAIDLVARESRNCHYRISGQIKEDIDAGSVENIWLGSVPSLNVQSNFGNGIRFRTNGNSQLHLKGPGAAPTIEAGPTLGWAFFRGYPQFQATWSAGTRALFFTDGPVVQLQENLPAGQTITLPPLPVSANGDLDPRYVGAPFWICNPSPNPVTVAGAGNNNGGTAPIIGAGASGTSFVLGGNSAVMLMASCYRSTGNGPTNLTYWARFGDSELMRIAPIGASLGTTGTVDLDLNALNGSLQTIAATGNLTFTTSNRLAGRAFELEIVAGASPRTLTWPAWTVFGAALPTTLAAGKTLSVTLFCRGTTEASIKAVAVESV